MSLPVLVTVIGVIGFVLSLYIFGFIFIHGSAPKGSKNDEWINTVCAPEGLHHSVFTWGYFKAGMRRFYNYYKVLLLRPPSTSVGKPAVDAKLVDLQGRSKSLLRDYILQMPKGKPLILNMGSYT